MDLLSIAFSKSRTASKTSYSTFIKAKASSHTFKSTPTTAKTSSPTYLTYSSRTNLSYGDGSGYPWPALVNDTLLKSLWVKTISIPGNFSASFESILTIFA